MFTRTRPTRVIAAGLLAGVLGACGATAVGIATNGGPGGFGGLADCPRPSDQAASTASLDISQYRVPGPTPGMSRITNGPDGNLWFTGGTVDTDVLGRITAGGVITLYHLPTKGGSPFGITTGPDGNIWFTERSAGLIGRLTPSTGHIDEFVLPAPTLSSTPRPTDAPSSRLDQPEDIVTGPDGNLWFNVGTPASARGSSEGGSIGRITPKGVITLFAVTGGDPLGVQVGTDGDIWSRLPSSSQCNEGGVSQNVVRVTPTGKVTEVSESRPEFSGSTVGPDGTRWWQTSTGAMRVTTASGQTAEYPSGLPANALGLGWATLTAFGPDGSIWYTGAATGILRMSVTGHVTRYAIPPCPLPSP